MAMSYFRKRKFEECVEICTKLLAKNPYDQVIRLLRRLFVIKSILQFDIV